MSTRFRPVLLLSGLAGLMLLEAACTGGAGGSPGGGNANVPGNSNSAPGNGNSENVNGASNGNANSAANGNDNSSTVPPPADPLGAAAGEPAPGIPAVDLAEFQQGRTVFGREFRRSEGLGPLFNATSCAACHEQPVTGGGARRYRNFYVVGRALPDGTISPVNISFTQPAYGPVQLSPFPSVTFDERRPIPADADVVAQRNPPSLLGIGLFERVSDESILAHEDANDADGDGISGRANRLTGGIGRFGVKAQVATLTEATRGLLLDQMGITSDEPGRSAAAPRRRSLFRRVLDAIASVSLASPAHAQVVVPPPTGGGNDDTVPDPEISAADLDGLIAYQRNLAPPVRGPIHADAQRGDALFANLGCADCHLPDIATSDGVVFHPYTDLLVHDMGVALGDGLVQGTTQGNEFRTTPLWRVSQTPPYLHDGRADTLTDAILLHAGEAQTARDRFMLLTDSERGDVLAFLNSL